MSLFFKQPASFAGQLSVAWVLFAPHTKRPPGSVAMLEAQFSPSAKSRHSVEPLCPVPIPPSSS